MHLSATERYLLDTILDQNKREAQERLDRFVAVVAQDRDIPMQFMRIDAESGVITDLRETASEES